MAARLNPQQDQRSRDAIRTTQLVKRLNCFALDELDDAGNVVELDSQRLRAIEILLKKTLPDLSATDINATVGISDPLADLIKQIQNGNA